MSWNNIPNEERLRLWKNLRVELEFAPFEEQMSAIAKFFANMPYGSRSLDYYSPNDWPTPWEILFHGSFCKSSISLLMFYTFALLQTGHTIELYLIDDNEDMYLVPVIDYQFVLNYELGTVNNWEDIQADLTVIKQFTVDEIKMVS